MNVTEQMESQHLQKREIEAVFDLNVFEYNYDPEMSGLGDNLGPR